MAEAHANLGSIYAQQKQWHLAIECYREAIGIKPNIPGFYRNLGKIWQELDKVELARDCQELEAAYEICQSILGDSPNFAPVYNTQGKVLQTMGKIELAITSYRQAIKLNPQQIETYKIFHLFVILSFFTIFHKLPDRKLLYQVQILTIF